MKELLYKIASTLDCFVHPPQGLPEISSKHPFPVEVRELYTLCGGITFYGSTDYAISIVPPDNFIPANKVMFAGVAQGDLDLVENDRSAYWHIIGKGAAFQFLVIDFKKEHFGKIYDCFWDSYAMPGYMPVVALSVYDLLLNLFNHKGKYFYWLDPDFVALGDAYDCMKDTNASKKVTSPQEAVALAKQFCIDNQWPWLEPIKIRSSCKKWMIKTNWGSRGANALIVISKDTGDVTDARFLPR